MSYTLVLVLFFKPIMRSLTRSAPKLVSSFLPFLTDISYDVIEEKVKHLSFKNKVKKFYIF